MRLEDFKHGGWEAFLHPDDFPDTARAFYHAIQTGTSYQAVNRLRRADGEFRWHHTRGEPLRDRQGRIVQWYGVSVDIDAAKKAEDRLRRSEAHLAEAQRLSHTSASAYNDSTILYWSDEMYRIWGFDPTQGIPSPEAVWQRIHPDDRDRARAEVERAFSEKTGYSIAYRIVLPDGTVKHLESIGQPVFSQSGEFVEVLATQIDVTERKRATGGVLVAVHDSGPGIDPDYLDRVFQAFYTTKSGGIGMGLSICRSIIDAHGGRLWADMNASRGAALRFSLPGAGKENRSLVARLT